jgi:hypothetical protein
LARTGTPQNPRPVEHPGDTGLSVGVAITGPLSATVLPELVAWMPAAGLSHILGPISEGTYRRRPRATTMSMANALRSQQGKGPSPPLSALIGGPRLP